MNCILLYFFNWDVCPIRQIVVSVRKCLVTEKKECWGETNLRGIRDNQHGERESVSRTTCVWLCKLKMRMCLKV